MCSNYVIIYSVVSLRLWRSENNSNKYTTLQGLFTKSPRVSLMKILMIHFGKKDYCHTWASWKSENRLDIPQHKRRKFKTLSFLYPDPGSNRDGSESTGVWDQRVYRFRHLGILKQVVSRLRMQRYNFFICVQTFLQFFFKKSIYNTNTQ